MDEAQKTQLLIELKLKVDQIEKTYVTQQELMPIKTFVYGIISISLLGVMAGILKLVLGE